MDALTSKYKNNEKESIAVAFFGDGATSQGVLHESMNLSSIWKLPVIFACENNGYAEATPSWYAVSTNDIASRAEGYGIPGLQVDGMDVEAVKDAGERASEYCRAGKGPYILEMQTYRYRGHSMSDPAQYRSKEEVSKMREERDPISNLRFRLINEKVLSEDSIKAIEKEIREIVSDAADFAQNSPEPQSSELYTDVYVDA